ncbi:UNVERIFIED_CONTAM: hypothetical protein Q9R71_17760 [Actinomycetes bacterium ARC8]|nr:hypothetical protein [Actinomycetes bacterium ARC8]
MKSSVRVRRYYWIDKTTQEHVDGVALMQRAGGRVIAHLSAQQARAMADKLHDLADALEATK